MTNTSLFNNDYRPDIDGLRAIAVLSVLFFHVFPNYFTGGFIGVDIFFVISGYLISNIIFKKLNNNEFQLTEFYIKRIQRIFPALILMLSASFIFGYFTLFADEYRLLAKHMIGASTFTSNFMLWHESGYFDKATQFKPLLHLWSLGIEEQFYLLWPLVAISIWKFKQQRIWIIILLITLSFIANIAEVRHHQVATFYLPFTRGWELILGIILAYATSQSVLLKNHYWLCHIFSASKRVSDFKCGIALILIGSSVFILDNSYIFPGYIALIPTCCALLIISANNSSINRYFLSSKIMVYIGLISYPLYLWHWPILAYFNIISSTDESLLPSLFIILLSFFLASITYSIEKSLRGSHAPWFKSTILFTLLCVIGLVGYYIVKQQGLPERLFVQNQKIAANDLNNFETYRQDTVPCEIKGHKYKEMSWCLQSKAGKPNVAIWGDSHADHLFPGIINVDKNNNWLLIGHTSCPPLLGIKGYFTGSNENTCYNNNNLAFKAIIKNKAIETVVLASLGPFYINGTDFAAQHVLDHLTKKYHLQLANKDDQNPDITKQQAFYAGLENTLKQLAENGKKVIIFQDIPELPFMPLQCINRPFSPKYSCLVSKDEMVKRQTKYIALLHKLQNKYPQVRIFDSTQYLCSSKNCIVMQGKNLIYRDSHHLSVYGSNMIAPHFFQWMHEIV